MSDSVSLLGETGGDFNAKICVKHDSCGSYSWRPQLGTLGNRSHARRRIIQRTHLLQLQQLRNNDLQLLHYCVTGCATVLGLPTNDAVKKMLQVKRQLAVAQQL